jgi:hypothetical protein
MHRRSVTAAALAICTLIACAPRAAAEMGPCQPDKFGGLTCGSGVGAARVIEDTLSPSKRLALAWRSAKGPPTEEPGGETEIIVVRLADGAVLATSTGTYWNTGEARANRLEELATWSPNSRLLIRSFNSRFSTDNVDLYAFGANDEVTGPLDLLKVMDPAVRAHLKRRVKDEQKYVFSISNEPAMSIGNSGLVRAAVMMWVPKDGPERNYNVTVRVMLGAKPLAARIVAVVPARAQSPR